MSRNKKRSIEKRTIEPLREVTEAARKVLTINLISLQIVIELRLSVTTSIIKISRVIRVKEVPVKSEAI